MIDRGCWHHRAMVHKGLRVDAWVRFLVLEVMAKTCFFLFDFLKASLDGSLECLISIVSSWDRFSDRKNSNNSNASKQQRNKNTTTYWYIK